jgi:hypothetical protein
VKHVSLGALDLSRLDLGCMGMSATTPVRGSTTQSPCAPSVTQLGEVQGRLGRLRDGLRALLAEGNR